MTTTSTTEPITTTSTTAPITTTTTTAMIQQYQQKPQLQIYEDNNYNNNSKDIATSTTTTISTLRQQQQQQLLRYDNNSDYDQLRMNESVRNLLLQDNIVIIFYPHTMSRHYYTTHFNFHEYLICMRAGDSQASLTREF